MTSQPYGVGQGPYVHSPSGQDQRSEPENLNPTNGETK